jgi:predicted HNH restriction endonuclease
MKFKIGNKYGSHAGFWKGKKLSIGHKRKLSLAKIGKCGELSNNWRGGVSVDAHSLTDPKYKKWRSAVFERDNWTCQTCGARGYVEPHHIKRWADYKELRYEVTNGVTLCKECHKLTLKNH